MVCALSGRSVVPSPVGQGSFEKLVYHDSVLRLECQVTASSQHSSRVFAVGRRDEQLVRPESSIAGATHRDIQGMEDGCVKRPGSGKVPYYQPDVIDQSPTVKLLRFHDIFLPQMHYLLSFLER
jgi:hypothetical protein